MECTLLLGVCTQPKQGDMTLQNPRNRERFATPMWTSLRQDNTMNRRVISALTDPWQQGSLAAFCCALNSPTVKLLADCQFRCHQKHLNLAESRERLRLSQVQQKHVGINVGLYCRTIQLLAACDCLQ